MIKKPTDKPYREFNSNPDDEIKRHVKTFLKTILSPSLNKVWKSEEIFKALGYPDAFKGTSDEICNLSGSYLYLKLRGVFDDEYQDNDKTATFVISEEFIDKLVDFITSLEDDPTRVVWHQADEETK